MINFTFKNNSGIEYNSLYDFGIYLSERPIFPRSERVIKYTPIEGRNGYLTEDTKSYKDIEFKLSCFLLNEDIINTKSEQLNRWLNGEGGVLAFSYYKDRYFKIKEIKSFGIKESSGIFGEFEVTFICEPFKYILSGENTITVTQQTTIFNKGTYESEPLLTIFGEGIITLTINNNNIILKEIDQYITLDCDSEYAYKDLVTNAQNDKMDGKFPTFKEGENYISWIGNLTKIDIKPRWRCL